MGKPFFWVAIWDDVSSRWKPLGCRRSFPATAELVAPAVVKLSPGAVHVGTVVCRTSSRREADVAFDVLPPPGGRSSFVVVVDRRSVH